MVLLDHVGQLLLVRLELLLLAHGLSTSWLRLLLLLGCRSVRLLVGCVDICAVLLLCRLLLLLQLCLEEALHLLQDLGVAHRVWPLRVTPPI